jgi:hypothetical protein
MHCGWFPKNFNINPNDRRVDIKLLPALAFILHVEWIFHEKLCPLHLLLHPRVDQCYLLVLPPKNYLLSSHIHFIIYPKKFSKTKFAICSKKFNLIAACPQNFFDRQIWRVFQPKFKKMTSESEHMDFTAAEAKELIINQLKREIDDLRRSYRDNYDYLSKISNLENMNELLQQEKRRIEDDQDVRSDRNIREIATLRSEVENYNVRFAEKEIDFENLLNRNIWYFAVVWQS